MSKALFHKRRAETGAPVRSVIGRAEGLATEQARIALAAHERVSRLRAEHEVDRVASAHKLFGKKMQRRRAHTATDEQDTAQGDFAPFNESITIRERPGIPDGPDELEGAAIAREVGHMTGSEPDGLVQNLDGPNGSIAHVNGERV